LSTRAGTLARIQLLVVCSANVCRSRMVEAYLRDRVATAGLPLTVTSVGVLPGGLEVPVEVKEILGFRAADLLERPGRELAPGDLGDADLILCMARCHVREVVVLEPSAWPRTFTLKELVRRGGAVGPRAASETVGSWLARVHEGRELGDLLGDSEVDDVADPYGGPISEYRQAATEISALVRQLVDELFVAEPSPEGSSAR